MVVDNVVRKDVAMRVNACNEESVNEYLENGRVVPINTNRLCVMSVVTNSNVKRKTRHVVKRAVKNALDRMIVVQKNNNVVPTRTETVIMLRGWYRGMP